MIRFIVWSTIGVVILVGAMAALTTIFFFALAMIICAVAFPRHS